MREVLAVLAVSSLVTSIGTLLWLELKGDLKMSVETSIAFAAVSIAATLLLRSDRDR
jgi:hypothetical protein